MDIESNEARTQCFVASTDSSTDESTIAYQCAPFLSLFDWMHNTIEICSEIQDGKLRTITMDLF